MDRKYKYVFGPVPSRRFGRSLGVDLTPYKLCSLDCVFCQLGRTLVKTVVRKEYIPIDEVLGEIKDWFSTGGNADYITLSGSGEPTLNSEFGKVLKFLKQYPVPSVLLTNGTLLHLPEVRESALEANIVKVSVSAWQQSCFGWVNRPHPDIKFHHLIDGIKDFHAQFKGKLWIEVFLILGINSMPSDVEKIASILKEIKPDRIHLNTVIRPPTEDFAEALPTDRMKELTHLFEPQAEVILDRNFSFVKEAHTNEDTILAMLQRRPCTMKQIEQAFGMHINEVSKYLGNLLRKELIKTYIRSHDVYYAVTT